MGAVNRKSDVVMIVDIDSWFYKTAPVVKEFREIEPCVFQHVFNVNKGVEWLREQVKVLENYGGTQVRQVILVGKPLFTHEDEKHVNFRDFVIDNYKGNRAKQAKPEALELVMEHFYNRYRNNQTDNKLFHILKFSVNGLETDDMIRVYADIVRDKGFKPVICGIDKDFKPLGDVYRQPFNEEVLEHDPLFWYKQALMGDSSDNIAGLKGYGEKTTNKLFEKVTTVEEAEKVCVDTYNKQKGDLDKLYRDFACLRLVTKKDLTKDNDGNIIKIQYHAFDKFFTINLEDETFTFEDTDKLITKED